MQEEYYEKFLSDFRSLPKRDQIFLSSLIYKLASGEITDDQFSIELRKKMISAQTDQ